MYKRKVVILQYQILIIKNNSIMLRIYLRKNGEESGKVFKSHRSIIGDKVRILPYGFVLARVITENEHAKCDSLITERFGYIVYESRIDGRKKLAKQLPYFSWSILLPKNKMFKY